MRSSRPASVLALLLSAALGIGAAPPLSAHTVSSGGKTARAAARAAEPGVPEAPTTLYRERFENVPDGSDPVMLTAYASTTGHTYTAAPEWLKECNGWVLNQADSAGYGPALQDCHNSTLNYNRLRDLTDALGRLNGTDPSTGNHAVAAFTYNSPGANSVEFETADPIPVSASNRFINFSVSSAAMNCFASGPQLKFFLMNGTTAIPTSSSPVNPCTDPGASSYTINGAPISVVDSASDKAVLFSGDEVGVRMINGNGSGAGNDAAFDDIRILDVTPSLDKAFSPGVVPTGGTSKLTFTVTNTSELSEKDGWSFTDDLPDGLKVADPASTSTTCTNGAVDATAGGASVKLKGDLNTGQTSCTLSVDVTSDTAGSYENCGEGNVTDLVGVDAPGCATVEFQDPRYTITKTSSPADGKPVVAGQKVDYTVTVKNPGDVPVAADVSDDLTGVLDDAAYNGDARADTGTVDYTRPKVNWSSTLAPGASAKITYSVTVDDPPGGDGVLTNAVTGNDRSNCATGSTDAGCTTDHPVADLEFAKTSDAKGLVRPGDKVTYTVTVTNRGKATYEGATFTDDLSRTLDDATYEGDAKATLGSVRHSSPKVTWTGDIPAGGTVTVTYSVRVHGDRTKLGDRELDNAVVSSSPGSNCPPDSTDPKCATADDVPSLTLAKTTDATHPLPGDKVGYTVAVTNDSDTVAYPDAAFSDDLTKVLDDASYNGDAVATSGTVDYAAPKVSWKGDIPAGGTVTLTYSVTVDETLTGDKLLTNAVTGDVPGTNCPEGSADPDCTTTTGLPSLKIKKTARPKDPRPGDTITYTVEVTDDGEADYPGATFTDDLTDVLDDAAYSDDAKATTGTVAYAEPKLTWTGDLTKGETATVTYSAVVDTPGDGDGRFVNGVTGPGSNCPPGSADPDCRSVLPAPEYDFGDAPDSFHTLRGNDGAYHELVDGLRLGKTAEDDENGSPGTGADADKGEDAVTAPTVRQDRDSTTLNVAVTNTTGRDAVLAGWLDRGEDGSFDAGDMATATVPDGATSATLTFQGTRGIEPGHSYLRLRLYGDDEAAVRARRALPAPSPVGYGGPGEIEDHRVRVEASACADGSEGPDCDTDVPTPPAPSTTPVPPARPGSPQAHGELPGTGSSDSALLGGLAAAALLALGVLATVTGRRMRRRNG
ncbi:DUF7927 domain-containing protein [Streptomyces endophyticus]|uniref:DUF11 domain-containing protein n=1 Tax=Streptomyces endophyticus TaxID=714166 RepID=A0ABU6FMU1_9ACTN|nr:GEVED domain-containing protein [Streptomyces endophyticus]MEB8344112.1 DUF11 domain-containing protein [Streptomyces endophyticus]